MEVADYSLNTELTILKALSETSLETGNIHKVILMVDAGDRREGIIPRDFIPMLREAKNCEVLRL